MVARILVFVTVSLLILSGCGDGITEHSDVDRGFSLVVDPRVTASPEHFTPGSQVSLNLSYEMRYRGCGTIHISGQGGGRPVGVLGDPYNAEIGSFSFPISFSAGRQAVPLTVEMSAIVQLPQLTFNISCDSLWTDEGMVGWETSAGHDVFVADIPPDTAFLSDSVITTVTIPREAK